jgi:hypothetical protein
MQMPSNLKSYKRDPNGKGRGAGIYYLRGRDENGDPIYSKYSRRRDKKKKSTGWKLDDVGLPRRTKIPHSSDGRLTR